VSNQEYLPILIFIAIGLLCGIVPLVIGTLLGPRHPNAQKNSPYECGFAPFKKAQLQFDIQFYLVAILFIIFDLEIVFLFPFALAFKEIPSSGLVGMGIFLALLTLGFIVEWKKGALEWE
jgi:NADH-quinone oxidoreductase subunit A